jgi:hypothetical protein
MQAQVQAQPPPGASALQLLQTTDRREACPDAQFAIDGVQLVACRGVALSPLPIVIRRCGARWQRRAWCHSLLLRRRTCSAQLEQGSQVFLIVAPAPG